MSILPSLSLLNKISQFIHARKEEKFFLNYGLFLLGWKAGLRVNEAISFDYRLKHSRHKDLYLVKGKGNKKRYVYVSKEIISELKTNHWKPNQTNRFAFGGFLKKVKEKLNIPANVELTPHTLRRCFTTHNALSGVPLPILQKALGHANIRTTSSYWKGRVDIREFSGWLEPDSIPKEPEGTPEVKKADNPQLPKIPKLENPNQFKELELLKAIEKLKGELEQKDLIIAEKDKRLKSKDSQISLLVAENEKLRIINQEKDRQLAEYRERLEEITKENNSLIQNYARLKNTAKNLGKSKENNNLLLNNLSKELQNNLLKEQEQVELLTQVQAWKPPN